MLQIVPQKKESLSDIVTLLAGDALEASASVLSISVDDTTIETGSALDNRLRVKLNGITNDHIDKTAITGQSDLGDAFADADTILLHDATASALREGTMAHLASYVNGAYDLEASLEALNSSDNIIKIGHSSDKVQIIGTFQVDGVSTLTGNTTVTGSLTANGLAFPANSAGSDGQVLYKASDGTIGFTSASSTSVNNTTSSSHLPIVLHDESNNLLDDTGTFTYQPSTGILKVPEITLPSTGVITFDDSTDFSLTHVANTGVLISGTQELQFGSNAAKIKEGGTGILNLEASTRVDVSGALTIGGTLTLPSQTAKHFFAAPTGSAGIPSFRVIAAADVPTLDQNTTGNAATATKFAASRNFSLTGDVTASAVSFDGSGNVALSTTIANNAVETAMIADSTGSTDGVTYAKMQKVSNMNRILGRVSPSDLTVAQLTKSDVLTMINVADGANAYVHPNHSGDVTSSADGAQTIANDVVTYAKIQNVSSNNVLLGNDNGANQGIQELSASDVRTMIGVDASGTDNSTNVSLSGTPDYITISGQVITRNQIDLTADVTGVLPSANLDADTAHLSTTQTFSGAKTFSSAVTISDTTDATSTTTGALKVAGGAGIEKSLFVEEDLFIGNAPGSDSTSARSIFSKYSGSNFLELANSSSSNGGRVILGPTSSDFNGLYSRNYNSTAGREFRLIQLSTAVITVAVNGDTTFTGDVTADDFCVSSDRRLKSEIKPIKEGLEVIKKFSSYNYIKGGEKESGFIAQEVREVLPHTVHENNEGYLSMSDRGVLAHMHKAILEIDKRLEAIEEKLK